MAISTEFDASAVAEARAGGSAALRHAWMVVLQRLGSAPGLSADHAEALARACPTPAAADAVAKLLARAAERPGGANAWALRLRRAADDSAFALDAWLAAVARVAEFAERRGVRAGPEVVTGYVQCCAEATVIAGAPGPLAAHTEQFLQTYGFAGGA